MDKLHRGGVTAAAEVPLSKALNPDLLGGGQMVGLTGAAVAERGPVELTHPGHKANKHMNKGGDVSSLYDLCPLHSVVHAQLSSALRAWFQFALDKF